MNPADFTDIDAMWATAPEGSSVDDGAYIAEILSIRPAFSQQMKRMVKLETEVIGIGTFAGRKLWKNWILESDDPEKNKTCIGMFKSDLRRLGVDVDAPTFNFGAFITSQIGVLINKKIKLFAVTKPRKDTGEPSQNINLMGKPKVLGSAVASEADIQAYAAGSILNTDGTLSAPGTIPTTAAPSAAAVGATTTAADPSQMWK